MRNEDLKNSFNKIEPDEFASQRMLNNVLNQSFKEGKVSFMKSFKLIKVISVLAFAVVITGGVLVYNLVSNKNQIPQDSVIRTVGDDREDHAIPLVNQFKIDDKNYILLSDEQKSDFKFPKMVSQAAIGEKLIVISETPDKSLMGCEVYSYLTAGCDAVVAVKKGNEYSLFGFFGFDSYNNNQDEDVATYLKLYGIKSAEDITKIQFIRHSEQSKIENKIDIRSEITDSPSIKTFYDFYSVIKNSSDKYFEKIMDVKGIDNGKSNTVSEDTAIPPDYMEENPDKQSVSPESEAEKRGSYKSDVGEREAVVAADLPAEASTISPSETNEIGATSGNTGSAKDVFFDSVTIRIYNQSGVYFDAEYYPNIRFISRHEVNTEFANFLKGHIG